MTTINLCWPNATGVNTCHTFNCAKRPDRGACPLAKGSSASVIESTWVPCIAKNPYNCVEEGAKPHSIQPAPAPVPIPNTDTNTDTNDDTDDTNAASATTGEDDGDDVDVEEVTVEKSDASESMFDLDNTTLLAGLGVGVLMVMI